MFIPCKSHAVVPLICLLLTLYAGYIVAHEDDDNELTKPNTAIHATGESKRLLVISLDGFRHDFINRGLPNIEKLIKGGVSGAMKSAFVTKTFPNHWTLATGLYEESHGIVGNKMYDPNWNEKFHDDSLYKDGKWYGGHPIWNTNELAEVGFQHRSKRHGGSEVRRSGVVYWPGSGTNVDDHNITYHVPFAREGDVGYLTFDERINKVLGWFKDEQHPINLGLIYYEQPDGNCHRYGPESNEVTEKLKEIDKSIGRLMEALQSYELRDVNLIIVSDHGFADIDPHPIYLDNYIDSSAYMLISNSPIMGIWPHDMTRLEEFYANLSRASGEGLLVHKKNSSELIKFHYNDNDRIAPLILSTHWTDSGLSAKLILQSKTDLDDEKGTHGWNNTWSKMHAVFIAHGPAFKRGFTKPLFDNVNIYPLMCHIVGVEGAPNNGSISVLEDILYKESFLDNGTVTTLIFVAVFCAIVAVIMIIGAARQQSKSLYSYNSRTNRSYNSNTLFGLSRTNGTKNSTAERSTLLISSDDEF